MKRRLSRDPRKARLAVVATAVLALNACDDPSPTQRMSREACNSNWVEEACRQHSGGGGGGGYYGSSTGSRGYSDTSGSSVGSRTATGVQPASPSVSVNRGVSGSIGRAGGVGGSGG